MGHKSGANFKGKEYRAMTVALLVSSSARVHEHVEKSLGRTDYWSSNLSLYPSTEVMITACLNDGYKLFSFKSNIYTKVHENEKPRSA